MLLIYIGKKPEGKIICSYSPKILLNKIFKFLFGYKTDKRLEEVVDVLNSVKVNETFVIPFKCINKNVLRILTKITNKNLRLILYLDKDQITKLKKYKTLLRDCKIYLDGKEISFDYVEKTYNIFPVSVTSFITLFYIKVLLYSLEKGFLQLVISITIFFLVVLRILIYKLPRE